jgi:hypothetical protein
MAVATIRANLNLPGMRRGTTAEVDVDDRWLRLAASGVVTILDATPDPQPPPALVGAVGPDDETADDVADAGEDDPDAPDAGEDPAYGSFPWPLDRSGPQYPSSP